MKKLHCVPTVADIVTPEQAAEILSDRSGIISRLVEHSRLTLNIWRDKIGPDYPFRYSGNVEALAAPGEHPERWALLGELLEDVKEHAEELLEADDFKPIRRGRLVELHQTARDAVVLVSFIAGECCFERPEELHDLQWATYDLEALSALLLHRQGMEIPPVPRA